MRAFSLLTDTSPSAGRMLRDVADVSVPGCRLDVRRTQPLIYGIRERHRRTRRTLLINLRLQPRQSLLGTSPSGRVRAPDGL